MKVIKGIFRIIFGLIAYVALVAAVSVPFLTASSYYVGYLSNKLSFLPSFPFWVSYVVAAAVVIIITGFVKLLPIIKNSKRFIAELIIFGAIYGAMTYVTLNFFKHVSILDATIVNAITKYVPVAFVTQVINSKLYMLIAGGILLVVSLLIGVGARALRNREKIERRLYAKAAAKKRATITPPSTLNVVSSSDNALSGNKPKKYVRDIWGNYIEEEEYNARINSSLNKKL